MFKCPRCGETQLLEETWLDEEHPDGDWSELVKTTCPTCQYSENTINHRSQYAGDEYYDGVRFFRGGQEIVLPSEQSTQNPVSVAALASIGGRVRVLNLTPDWKYSLLDPKQTHYKILHVASAATLELGDVIEKFEDLINRERARESDFQRFFEEHPSFILGDEHRRARSHLVLEAEGGALIPDFVLEPIECNGLADLLELKLPSARVLVYKKARLRHSAEVMEACAQLREYSAFFEDPKNREYVRSRYGLHAYRPRLYVIMGRQPKVDAIEFRRVSDDLPARITLRTYDELLARMRSRLARLKGLEGRP